MSSASSNWSMRSSVRTPSVWNGIKVPFQSRVTADSGATTGSSSAQRRSEKLGADSSSVGGGADVVVGDRRAGRVKVNTAITSASRVASAT